MATFTGSRPLGSGIYSPSGVQFTHLVSSDEAIDVASVSMTYSGPAGESGSLSPSVVGEGTMAVLLQGFVSGGQAGVWSIDWELVVNIPVDEEEDPVMQTVLAHEDYLVPWTDLRYAVRRYSGQTSDSLTDYDIDMAAMVALDVLLSEGGYASVLASYTNVPTVDKRKFDIGLAMMSAAGVVLSYPGTRPAGPLVGMKLGSDEWRWASPGVKATAESMSGLEDAALEEFASTTVLGPAIRAWRHGLSPFQVARNLRTARRVAYTARTWCQWPFQLWLDRCVGLPWTWCVYGEAC